MAASNSKLRNSLSFPNLLLSCINLILFILSLASLIPIILLKTPPTSLGFALLISSLVSIISSFIGFYSHLTHFWFMIYVSFILASLSSQTLGFLALFMKEKTSLSMLNSSKDPREAKVLVRLECGILMVLFVLQVIVLVLTCVIHRCWVREYEELEVEKGKTARKQSMRSEEETMVKVANSSRV